MPLRLLSTAPRTMADSVSKHRNNNFQLIFSGREIPSRSGRYSPDQILPWVSFAPMYPIDQSRGRANSSSSTIFKGIIFYFHF